MSGAGDPPDNTIRRVVFAVFAYLYLGESIRWNYIASFGCIMAAVVFAFWGKPVG